MFPILDPQNVTTLYHPLFSPDLSPPDYFMFPNLKNILKGLNFTVVAEIQEAITNELKKVQQKEFSAVFQKLYDPTKTCVHGNAAYFE
jgi:histone-lysine N-methyltransferase SETMAR